MVLLFMEHDERRQGLSYTPVVKEYDNSSIE